MELVFESDVEQLDTWTDSSTIAEAIIDSPGWSKCEIVKVMKIKSKTDELEETTKE